MRRAVLPCLRRSGGWEWVKKRLLWDGGIATCRARLLRPSRACRLEIPRRPFSRNRSPDGRGWRPLGALSGGQLALASLALSLALQAVFPAPFYVYDEVDCALDSVNARRVAEYMLLGQPQEQPREQRQAHVSGSDTGGGDGSGEASGLEGHKGRPPGGGGRAAAAATTPATAPSAQFFVVSHKPAMFERAGAMIGVYTLPSGGGSAALSVRLAASEE